MKFNAKQLAAHYVQTLTTAEIAEIEPIEAVQEIVSNLPIDLDYGVEDIVELEEQLHSLRLSALSAL